ncbi:c-type cytochrome [Cupriavidus lacunae]|uniref:c-type cytochrome n=1 Tax=Cupriavidus lacunae TaxID=2666307 RepID=UPI001FC9D887|nr:cytochrome c [Cupriavidus lacunae]
MTPGNPDSGRQIARAKCAACHGTDGNSPDPKYPKLAEQNPVYLYQQLRKFGTGVRRSDVMTEIAAGLSDQEMADVARFFSQRVRHPEPVRYPGLEASGRRSSSRNFTGRRLSALPATIRRGSGECQ